MSDPTPHIENSKVPSGDRATPVITDLTNGGQSNSRIWHTKENDQFFEYRQINVTKKAVNLVCIYFALSAVKCPAKLQIQPLAPNLISSKKGKRQNVFSINYDTPLNHADWAVVPNSGNEQHSEYCCNQIRRRDRIYDKNVINHGKAAEVRAEKRKYCRNGQTGALVRSYRTTHTGMSEHSQRLETTTVENMWNMVRNHGSQFLPMVLNLPAEKRSAYYHMAKNRDATSGISRESLICRLTNPETYEAVEEIYIHLEQETENFLPIYLESELSYLHDRELFGDGTWSLTRNLPNRMQVYIFSIKPFYFRNFD